MIMVIYLLMTLQTEDKHIYAAGDCIGKLQLAHVSSKEAILLLNTCLMAMDYL